MPDCPMPGQVSMMGNGGNTTLINQNEDMIRACVEEDVAIRRHDDGSYTVDDDFSMVSSIYREEPPL
jgi:hypothetical protein